MRYAARFGLPIVTFVDTPGAYPGPRGRGARPVGGDRRGDPARCRGCRSRSSRRSSARAAAAARWRSAAADRVLILEGSYYSVISPEGCATILFKDALAAPRAAAALRMSAPALLRLGVVDAVVLEPDGGRAHRPDRDRREPQDRDRGRACDELLALSDR